MKEPKPRYQLVYISVRIATPERGLTDEQIEKKRLKIEKAAKGRSTTWDVSVVVE